MHWLDYSAAKLSGATIKAAGYGGVIRYIDAPNLLKTKHTNKAEYDDHIRNGLVVRLVMQTTTTASDGGHAVGVDHAQRALAGANYLGYRGPIYFTNDRTTVPEPSSWTAYLVGAASVLGWNRVGAYGFANAMDIADQSTSCQHFWQAGRASDIRPFVQIWQDNNVQVTVGGVLCDRNLILKDVSTEVQMELTDRITWWNGKWVTVKDALAENYIASRGLAGKRAFDTDPATDPIVTLPPFVALNNAMMAVIAEVTNDPDITLDAIGARMDQAVRDNTPVPAPITEQQLDAMADRVIAGTEATDKETVKQGLREVLFEGVGEETS
jgi:hypothetical protein